GYSMGRSDLVRRAMSKKKHDIMEKERKNFIYGIDDEDGNIEVMGCVRNGIDEKAASRLFDQMMDFASYAFPKAHAAAYAVVGYQTAYLMKYYPVEYIAAMLNSVYQDAKKVAEYIRFAKDKGITVLPPDINESFAKFTVKNDSIRFGLSAIKNVGSNLIKNVVEVRESKGKFIDYGDFCNKISANVVNKRAVESLIKAGAFDLFNVYRSKLIAIHDKVLDSIHSSRKKNIEGQLNLFSDFYDEVSLTSITYPDIKEYDKNKLYAFEKEITGLYVTGHPLEDYAESIDKYCNINVAELLSYSEVESDDEIIKYYNVKDGDKVIIGGIITSVSLKYTRNDQQMAFITIEDLTGFIEVIIFPKIYQVEKLKIAEDNVVIVKGKVSLREDEEPKITCDSVDILEKKIEEKSIRNYYILVNNRSILNNIKSIILKFANAYKGECSVFLCTKEDRKKYELNQDYSLNEECYDIIKNYFGDKNVKLM
ncbi:MAG: OB-fold nucleic acid binding domain-containing protein, partial [Oscillospiraceae bacterium]|nr:OB-fold nucleic acid binding domain-containing protein [Oscillospiraceae bacterium]